LQLFENGRSIAFLTGSRTLRQSFVANGKNLRILFVANSSAPRQGFQAAFRLGKRFQSVVLYYFVSTVVYINDIVNLFKTEMEK